MCNRDYYGMAYVVVLLQRLVFLCLVLVSLSYLLAISSYLRDRSESMIKEACETKSSRHTSKIQKQPFTGV